jgi:hypothetical protein
MLPVRVIDRPLRQIRWRGPLRQATPIVQPMLSQIDSRLVFTPDRPQRKARRMTDHTRNVEEETSDSLTSIAKEFDADFKLMDEVLAYVQGLLTKGGLRFTNGRGLNIGIVYLAASILAKGCKTFRAIHAAARAGCGQDASILLRALFESTMALLYILQRDSRRRAILYGAHEAQRKLVLVEETRKTPGQKRFFKKADLEKAKARVDQWSTLVTAAEVASVRKHWSGRGGLESATKKLGRRSGWPRVYTMMYRYLSAFSHGSDSSAHIFMANDAATPVLKLLPGTDELDRVLPMACMHLLAMAERFNQRLGLELEDDIKALTDRSLALAKSRAVRKGAEK